MEGGVALKGARRRREATYPELCRGNGKARHVVIAGGSEAGGRKKQRTSCGLGPARSPSLLGGCCRRA